WAGRPAPREGWKARLRPPSCKWFGAFQQSMGRCSARRQAIPQSAAIDLAVSPAPEQVEQPAFGGSSLPAHLYRESRTRRRRLPVGFVVRAPALSRGVRLLPMGL